MQNARTNPIVIDTALDEVVISRFTKEVCYTYARMIAIHKQDSETLSETAMRIYKRGYLPVSGDNFEMILNYLETESRQEKEPFYGCNDE